MSFGNFEVPKEQTKTSVRGGPPSLSSSPSTTTVPSGPPSLSSVPSTSTEEALQCKFHAQQKLSVKK